jgi:flagellar biosynthesis/type III secretory pathway M-ring protein FliF/YscJ
VADVEGALEAHVEEEEAVPVPRRLPSLTRRMVKATQSEPENAARLVRDWLSEDVR